MTRRRLADPFVVAPPAKAVAKTRLRPSEGDEEVLFAVGWHLGSLLRSDVAARCRLGPGVQAPEGRAERKRRLTPECSSRWAGAITRTADEMYALGMRNLKALKERDSKEIAEIDRRAALPTADRRGDAPNVQGDVGATDMRARPSATTSSVGDTSSRRAWHETQRQRLAEGRRVDLRWAARRWPASATTLRPRAWPSNSGQRHWDARRECSSAPTASPARRGATRRSEWCPTHLPTSAARRLHRGHPAARAARAPVQHLRARPDLSAVGADPLEPPRRRMARTGAVQPLHRLQPSPSTPSRGTLVHHRRLVAARRRSPRRSPRSRIGPMPRHRRQRRASRCPHPRHLRQPHRSGRKVVQIPQEGTTAQRLGAPARRPSSRLYSEWGKEQRRDLLSDRVPRTSTTHANSDARSSDGADRAAPPAARCAASPPPNSHTPSHRPPDRHQIAVVAVDAAYTSRWGRRWWQQPLNQSRRQRGDGHAAAAVVIGRRSQGHSEKRRSRTHPPRPEDRQGRTSAEQTADTTGMATATSNDECEHLRDATTTRPQPRPAARTGVQHRSGRRRQNNHLSV